MSDTRLSVFGRLFTPAERGLATVSIDPRRRLVTNIEPARRPSPGALGGPDCLIVPGLIDLQVNGAFGEDFSNPGANIGRVASLLPQFGVTAFMPTVVSSVPEIYEPCLRNLALPLDDGRARVLGVHLEGPFLSRARVGTHDPAMIRDPSWAEAERWLASGLVRMLTLAPELPGAPSLIRKVVRRGVVVALGHSDATAAEARRGVEAGASLGTHLFNAMRPFRHRDAGIAGYLLAADIAVSVIADLEHLDADTLRLIVRAKPPGRLVLVTDALAGLGFASDRFELGGRELIRDGLVARRPDGTLSGSLLPLNLAIRNLVNLGAPIGIAVRAATRTPAEIVREPRRVGRISVGGPADLVVLDPRWEVVQTLIGGTVAFDAAGRAH